MAKKSTKSKQGKKSIVQSFSFKLSNQQKLIVGSLLIIIGILLFISFLSFLFTGKADQSVISEFPDRNEDAQNWAKLVGAQLSDFFITKGFGISSFIFSGLLFLSGIYVALNLNKTALAKHWIWGTLIVIWLSVFFGFFTHKYDFLGGIVGFETNHFLQDYTGKIGTVLILVFGLIVFLALKFNLTAEHIVALFKRAKNDLTAKDPDHNFDGEVPIDNSLTEEAEEFKSAFDISPESLEPTIKAHSKPHLTKEKKEDIDQPLEVIKPEDEL